MSAFMKEYTGTGSWVAIESTSVPFKGTLAADIANTGNVLIRVVGSGVSTKLIPGENYPIEPINLNTIEIQGSGAILKAIGTSLTGQA